jgi:TorA maturation chaperone TorD
MMNVEDVEFEGPDQAEEQARAELYALLAELFYAPPSEDLVEKIASSRSEGESMFDTAWNELSQACAGLPLAAILEEYEQLFISVGKPEVVLFGSYYMAGFMMEKPLAELRDALVKLGLERAASVSESEDHVAALCEVMRYLILNADGAEHSFAEQKQFFADFIQPWMPEMCNQLAAHPAAGFYAAVAGLMKAFLEVEAQAFEMA